MRCKNCGRFMNFLLHANGDINYYLCMCGLTSFLQQNINKSLELIRKSKTLFCNTVQSEEHKIIPKGKVLYYLLPRGSQGKLVAEYFKVGSN